MVPDRSHLVECVRSATTILAIYDLFVRSYGETHVVLSLAYSVYTAISIFILEIRALKTPDPTVMEKLKYGIRALERAAITSPGKTA